MTVGQALAVAAGATAGVLILVRLDPPEVAWGEDLEVVSIVDLGR